MAARARSNLREVRTRHQQLAAVYERLGHLLVVRDLQRFNELGWEVRCCPGFRCRLPFRALVNSGCASDGDCVWLWSSALGR
jgi:hypothetical protein